MCWRQLVECTSEIRGVLKELVCLLFRLHEFKFGEILKEPLRSLRIWRNRAQCNILYISTFGGGLHNVNGMDAAIVEVRHGVHVLPFFSALGDPKTLDFGFIKFVFACMGRRRFRSASLGHDFGIEYGK